MKQNTYLWPPSGLPPGRQQGLNTLTVLSAMDVMPTDSPDPELVAQARAGSRAAAGELVRRYLSGCRATALAIVGDITVAEDACQDGLVYAMAHLHDCRQPDRFGAWLRQIVRSHARTLARRERRARSVPLEGAQDLADRARASEAAERNEVRRALLAALATLSEVRREVVLLHDLEGWTHREIAERMELPEGTVRSHLHLARQALRKLLAGHDRE
jgi:RNA polymerase sigma-70 factor (ECF subfamily)